MTSREKFEAWYLENWGHTEDDHETLFERDPDSDEEYYRLGVRLAHGAWQASELASQQKLTDMAVQLANAESKCRELAAATPEGYVLAPQQIFLGPSDIESIFSQCGDGHESGYGDFTDGLLWVGNIQRDDGSIVHGLHISSADYPEEGGLTICEFAAQLRQEAAQ